MCASPFADAPNKKKTLEGASFASAPASMLPAESFTIPVQHTREEVVKSEGIVQSRLLSRETLRFKYELCAANIDNNYDTSNDANITALLTLI